MFIRICSLYKLFPATFICCFICALIITCFDLIVNVCDCLLGTNFVSFKLIFLAGFIFFYALGFSKLFRFFIRIYPALFFTRRGPVSIVSLVLSISSVPEDNSVAPLLIPMVLWLGTVTGLVSSYLIFFCFLERS